MVFREVSVIEIREVLWSWLAGAGLRESLRREVQELTAVFSKLTRAFDAN
jgi:hypothetical protein